MTCRKFKRLWSARFPGDLPPAAHTHLSSCPACAAMARADSATHDALRRPVAAQPILSADSAQAAIRVSRRGFIAGLTGLFAGMMMRLKRSFGNETLGASSMTLPPDAPVEYIVVGSGPGGGPLACNLAKAGHKVVLFEAGGDDADDIAAVPLLAALTSEDPRIRWDYFVRHYANTEQQQRDSKYLLDQDGVWYPRVGSLGGCAVHATMINIYPSDSDWDHIAKLTGDPSWKATNMRRYFERLEQCRYVHELPGGRNPSRHGFDGWQPTEMSDPAIFAQDRNALRIVLAAAQQVATVPSRLFNKFFRAALDPNDWRVQEHREGMYNIPQFTLHGRRFGPRDFIRQTAAALPNNLIVKTHTLVTRVLFDDTTATGVEYLEGAHLYRADPQASPQGPEPGPRQTMLASREVILSCGTFNSPQILKLSGIGPADELRSHGIEPIVDLPGVGENLQDRYEVGVVTEMNSDFTFRAACTPGQPDDPCFAEWLQGRGPYTSPSAPLAIIQKSNTAREAGREDADLVVFAFMSRFKGYYPGWSVLDVLPTTNQFTWTILKAHTRNRAGNVKLHSADPRDRPVITFHYFDEGSDKTLEDLESLVDGVEYARRVNKRIADISKFEVIPGPLVESRADIAEFVRNEAWGHHASCTNKIGTRDDPMAVVDGDFRVHGTRNLRVVDASVFPRIPGYFVLLPILIISEKASDVILADAE